MDQAPSQRPSSKMKASTKGEWQLPVFAFVGFFLYLASHENGHAAACILTGNRISCRLPIHVGCSDSKGASIAIVGILSGVVIWGAFIAIFLFRLLRLRRPESWFAVWVGCSLGALVDVLLQALLVQNPAADSARFIEATRIPPLIVMSSLLLLFAVMLSVVLIAWPTCGPPKTRHEPPVLPLSNKKHQRPTSRSYRGQRSKCLQSGHDETASVMVAGAVAEGIAARYPEPKLFPPPRKLCAIRTSACLCDNHATKSVEFTQTATPPCARFAQGRRAIPGGNAALVTAALHCSARAHWKASLRLASNPFHRRPS